MPERRKRLQFLSSGEWNPGRGKICTPRRVVAVSLSWVRTQAVSARWTDSRYFRGIYLSMAFNIVTLNIVTRLTFLQATNACTRVWFSAQDARMHAYYRVSFRYLRKVSKEGSCPRFSRVNTWGFGRILLNYRMHRPRV